MYSKYMPIIAQLELDTFIRFVDYLNFIYYGEFFC